jgi:hypothetical protein
MRALIILMLAATALSGCTTENDALSAAPMAGPCRTMALERTSDAKAAGYDAATLSFVLSWTYNDCVVAREKYGPFDKDDGRASKAGQ